MNINMNKIIIINDNINMMIRIRKNIYLNFEFHININTLNIERNIYSSTITPTNSSSRNILEYNINNNIMISSTLR